jgi:glycosyltransferase involved in cell wall biosynthesis
MILEAMSMGAVPVCTSVGEVAKKIDDYGAGVVLKADAGDEEAILEETAEGLSRLALDRALLNDHFEQGKALSALYEPRHVTLVLEKILRKYVGC